jgi:bifunctional non-homologous end joining protein LigD
MRTSNPTPGRKPAPVAPVAKARAPRASSALPRITSPDRVVYPDCGITKGQVAEYYRAIADRILPELADRPLSLVRCPDGAAGTCFFQKHHAPSLGAHVRVIPLRQKSGEEDYFYVRDAAGLLELVQMNALEFHPWGSKVAAPERPDRLVFDLDPDPGIEWKRVQAAARDVRAQLAEFGLQSFLRLSGGKGLHVVVPIRPVADWDAAKDFSEAFARSLEARKPDAYVATMSKAKRAGRIFVDWLRNSRGATSVTSWSLRARPGAPVAVPLRWEELGRVRAGNQFGLEAALARARRLRVDPWDGIATLRQTLPKLD